MREFFEKLFTGEIGGEFKPFCVTHIICLLILVGSAILVCLLFKYKNEKSKNKFLNILCIVVLGLYLLDFFTHPFINKDNPIMKSYDKLPFHLCTSCAILIPISRLLQKKFAWFKTITSTLGIIGSSFYLIYPAFSGHMQISYYVFQSMLYHMVLFLYSFSSFVFEDVKPKFKSIYQVAIAVACQIGIAKIANIAYAQKNSSGIWENHNWYFIEAGSLGLPFNAYVMPIMVFIGIVLGTAIVFSICYLVEYINNKRILKLFALYKKEQS